MQEVTQDADLPQVFNSAGYLVEGTILLFFGLLLYVLLNPARGPRLKAKHGNAVYAPRIVVNFGSRDRR